LVAAVASLKDPDQVKRSVAMNAAGKQYLYGEFERMGLDYQPTQSNFVFVNVQMDSKECFDRLMRRGVTVRTGDIFGFDNWIRVTIGTREQNERFIAALEQARSD